MQLQCSRRCYTGHPHPDCPACSPTFVEGGGEVEARFLVDGEVFERKSVRFTVVGPVEREGTVVHVDVYAEYSEHGGQDLVEAWTLPSRLLVSTQGRYC